MLNHGTTAATWDVRSKAAQVALVGVPIGRGVRDYGRAGLEQDHRSRLIAIAKATTRTSDGGVD